jgi:hypothetical protein
MAIWNIVRTFGIFYDHLVHFVLIWSLFPVITYQEKSGNPARPSLSLQEENFDPNFSDEIKVFAKLFFSSRWRAEETRIIKAHTGGFPTLPYIRVARFFLV